MKTLFLTTAVILLASCNGNVESKRMYQKTESGNAEPMELKTNHGFFNQVSKTTIEQHEYLVVETAQSLSVCHSGSCWCNTNAKKSIQIVK
jgi:hypothetical protein